MWQALNAQNSPLVLKILTTRQINREVFIKSAVATFFLSSLRGFRLFTDRIFGVRSSVYVNKLVRGSIHATNLKELHQSGFTLSTVFSHPDVFLL